MTLLSSSAISADQSFERLSAELAAAMGAWERDGTPWGEKAFTQFALRCFRLQYDRVEPYRRFCDRRGARPSTVADWTEIPAVPVAAFRTVPLIVGGESTAKLEFRTSGTTGGPERRGRHLVRDPALYRASMEAAFHRLVLGDRTEPPVMMSLVPPFDERTASSLAWMIDGLIARFGGPGSGHVASPSGLDSTAATDLVREAVTSDRPVCILTTTLALDAWVRRLRSEDLRWTLPAGSTVMDTGGAKGRAGIDRPEVCEGAAERLGIDRSRIVNEFGMTELQSQLYSRPTARGDRVPLLVGPPWLRTRALDPNDLSSLPDGETGVLCHFDLANAGSVCAVLTEDMGRVYGNAVEWQRRSPGAAPRGCSLATAELLAAQDVDAGG
jgi:hypothetical protein